MKRTLFKLLVILFCGFSAILFLQKVDAQSQSADSTEQENREKTVIDRFWTILAKNPRRGTSLDRVYSYYIDAGQVGELVEKCRKLTVDHPHDAKSHLLLGLVLSRRNDDNGTIKAFQKAESLDINDALASFYLGETFIAQGRLQDAAAALERAAERKPSRNDILNVMQTLGRVYERFGDREKSANLWNKMEEMFPDDSDILVRIAETLEEEGKYDHALGRYQKLAEMAAAKKDNYARVRFVLSAADIKIRMGNKQNAINDFEKLLDELARDNWLADSVRNRIERVFVRQADYAGLAGYYQKRLAKHPNDVETTRRLATAMVRLGRTADAKELLIKTLEKSPSNAALRLALIDLYVNDREFDEADKQYAVIDKNEPNNPDTISQWGLVALENHKLPASERKAAAAKIWLRLVNARPNDTATIIMVADLMTGGKINDEAEKLYQKAVELAPNDPSYREYLGLFYHRTEQKEKAVATLRQIAEGTRRTAANLTQLGSIFKGLGYADESREALKEAAELAPKDFNVQLAYLDAVLQSGDLNAMKYQLQTAEKLVETDEELQAFTTVETEAISKAGELTNTIETLEKAVANNHSNDAKAAKNLWRLAVYSRAAGQWDKAVSAIEQAMQIDVARQQSAKNATSTTSLTLMILGTAADIFTQAFDEKRAAEIYERLANADAAHRVDHLKRLANLQRDMGQSDKAIETARLVMATGAGNTANSRFYADMLIGVGRRSDGIEALRRAVRIDPADQVSLTALAEQLAQDGQLDEAIEITWRIFDRTEDLQGKIGQVGKLSNYYQQGNRFDQLVARLRQDVAELGKRRNSAYCLAQAHVTVGDYFAARNALEMLLTNVDDEKNSDTFLLDQLSRVSEMQGDLAAAVRYQEMLCDQTNQSQDRDRLLGLYYAAGERDKASSVYLQMTTSNVDFADQINVLDKLLAREDYSLAQQLLERMEMKHSGHWELMYRKMELTYWLAGKDAAQREQALKDADVLAAAIFASNNQDNELSAKEQTTSSKTVSSSGSISGGGNSASRSMGTNYSAWGFGQHQGYNNFAFNFYQPGMGTVSILATWGNQNHELIQTLFRERLQLELHYYQRGNITASVGEPEKPLFKPLNFGDAKFAAQMWQMKFAYDLDVIDFEKNHPEEAKLLKESGGLGKDVNPTRTIYASQTPVLTQNDRNDSPVSKQTEEEKAKIEKIEKALTFDRLLPLVEKIQNEFPDDSNDKTVLLARLRFEIYLDQQIRETAMDDDIIFPPSWETRINAMANNPNSIVGGSNSAAGKVTIKLGLLGEKDWKNSAFHVILQRTTAAAQLEFYELQDKETLIADAVKLIPQSTNPADKPTEKGNSKTLEKIFEAARENYDKILSDLRKQAEENIDGMTNNQRLDWLLRTTIEMADSDPKQMTSQIYYFNNLISGLPTIYHLLEHAGRKDDTAKLDDVIEKLAENMPQIYVIGMLIDDQESLEKRWLKAFSYGISVGKILPLPLGAEAMDVAAFTFEDMQKWVTKIKNTTIKNLTENKPLPLNIGAMQQMNSPEVVVSVLVIRYVSNKIKQKMPAIFGTQQLQVALQQIQPRGVGISYFGDVGLGGTIEAQKINNKIDKKELEAITQAKEELRRVLDFYLAVIGEIHAAEKNASNSAQSPALKTTVTIQTLASGRRGSSLLNNYRSYFQSTQIDANSLQNILQQIQLQTGNSQVMVNESNALNMADQFMHLLDLLVKDYEPGEGVTKEQIQANNAEWLKQYLTEKEQENLPDITAVIQQYRKTAETKSQHPLNSTNQQENIQDTLKSLEKEYAESKEKQESFPQTKLISLALIYKSQNELVKAAETLDEIPFTSASDVKTRETIILRMYSSVGENADQIKKRAEQAVNRLLGYQLTTEDLRTLRSSLIQLDRKAEAEAIRDRLLVSATDLNTMGELFNELRNNAGNDEKKKEQLVKYALKMYRSPALSTSRVLQSNSYERHLRDEAINVLQNAGKLGEIVEQIEAQWKSSPGSMDITLSLINIYNKAGRKDDAKKLLDQLKQSPIPDDSQKIIQFAQTLRSLGEQKDAAEWMSKGLAKKPELLFQGSYWDTMNFYQEINQQDKFLEFLKGMNPKIVLTHSSQFSELLSNMRNNGKYKKQVWEIFESLWQLKDGTDAERQQLRRSLINPWVWNGDSEPEIYPYFREVVWEAIAVPNEQSHARRGSQVVYSSIHYTQSWSSEGAKSLSYTFVNLAEKSKSLETLKKEVQEAVAAHEKIEENKRNWNCYFDAKMLEAMVDLKTNDVKHALEIFKTLKEKRQTLQYWENSNNFEMPLVQLLENQDDSQAIQLGIELCERAARLRQGGSSPIETLYQTKLIKLYLKSGNKEKGREEAVAVMKSNLTYLKHCATSNNGNVQIGNNYYSIYELSQILQSVGNLLKNTGEGIVLLKIYREQCEGQIWYKTFVNNKNWSHYSTMVRGIFDSVLERVSAEEIAANIEMFIPLPQTTLQTTDKKETEKTPNVPLFLGIYRKSFRKEMLSSIIAAKLFDALAVIAKNDVEKFATIRTSLDLLEKEHPNDFSVALTKTWCAMLANEPAENIAVQVKYCAKQTASDARQKQSDESLYAGAWIIAREIYMNPEKYDAERFADDCETLTVFATKYISKKLETSSSSASASSDKEAANALREEFHVWTPKQLADKLRVSLSVETLKNLLVQNGKLVNNLDSEFYNIRDQYIAVAKAGGTKDVLAVFESIWENGWMNNEDRNSTTFDRYRASQVLWIFDAVYHEAIARGDKGLAYESLKKIVLTDDPNKPLFFGIYNDLGGPNGRFRSLMSYLVESSSSTLEHAEELLRIIETKRQALADQPYQIFMLDALELSIAVMLRDTYQKETQETIQKLTAKFKKLVRDEKKPETGVLVLLVLAETLSPNSDDAWLESLNASLQISQQGLRYSRYAYHVIRRTGLFWKLEQTTDKTTIETLVDLAELYRKIVRESRNLEHIDGFRTAMDDQLLLILENVINNDNVPTAMKILKYFAEEPKDSQRYRDLGKYLDLLKTKLDALDESKRNELLTWLGNIKFEDIARESTKPIDTEGNKPRIAETFGLPTLPEGTVVYETDFENSVDKNWATPSRDYLVSHGKRRAIFGEFCNATPEFSLDKLPPHKFLRIRFDLYMFEGLDGLVGSQSHFGVDSWKMELSNGIVPIGTTFSNYDHDPNNQKQSYPDDYPPLFNRKPSWYNRVENEEIWANNLETGFYYGRHGAVEQNSFSGLYSGKSAVYAVDMIVPHAEETLGVTFSTQFQDGPYENSYNLSFGECWGLDNFRVETLNEPLKLTDEEVKRCFDALLAEATQDGVKANAARWRLVAAGDATVDFVEQWASAPENAAKCKELTAHGNFPGFRLERVLQLIHTQKSETLRKKLFEK
ncbi:MAG: tetratricopeptide repeat protein [Planctomycetaceae bacterium]|jgi:tetratricopeptide (TPR) repeat protein|nr:tetratricopeptide repeat protein [Planctomycetaceae bacterium]